MLTIHSNWYADPPTKVGVTYRLLPIHGAVGMSRLTPYAYNKERSNSTVHLHPTAGLYQTFSGGDYVSMPYSRYVPPGVLKWRWNDLKKRRSQKRRTRNYQHAKPLYYSAVIHPEAQHIRDEYSETHDRTGIFLNINA